MRNYVLLSCLSTRTNTIIVSCINFSSLVPATSRDNDREYIVLILCRRIFIPLSPLLSTQKVQVSWLFTKFKSTQYVQNPMKWKRVREIECARDVALSPLSLSLLLHVPQDLVGLRETYNCFFNSEPEKTWRGWGMYRKTIGRGTKSKQQQPFPFIFFPI